MGQGQRNSCHLRPAASSVVFEAPHSTVDGHGKKHTENEEMRSTSLKVEQTQDVLFRIGEREHISWYCQSPEWIEIKLDRLMARKTSSVVARATMCERHSDRTSKQEAIKGIQNLRLKGTLARTPFFGLALLRRPPGYRGQQALTNWA